MLMLLLLLLLHTWNLLISILDLLHATYYTIATYHWLLPKFLLTDYYLLLTTGYLLLTRHYLSLDAYYMLLLLLLLLLLLHLLRWLKFKAGH